MAKLTHELQSFLDAVPGLWPAGKVWVQKIYSTSTHLVWTLRFPQQTRILYIARSALSPLIGFGTALPPPAQRCQDRFLDYVRAFARGCSLGGLRGMPQEDQLGLSLWHGPQLRMLLFYWLGPELYFLGGEINFSEGHHHAAKQEKGADSSSMIYDPHALQVAIFCSWQRKKIIVPLFYPNVGGMLDAPALEDILWDILFQQAETLKHQTKVTTTTATITTSPSSSLVSSSSALTSFQELPDLAKILFNHDHGAEKQNVSVTMAGEQKAAIKFLRKKIKNIEKDLAELKKWRYFFDLVQSPDFTPPEEDRWTNNGVLFRFQGREGFQKVDYIYQKIKRWKAAEVLQVRRLEACYQELKRVQHQKGHLGPQKIREPMWADRWEKSKNAKAIHQGHSAKSLSSRAMVATLHPDCRRYHGPQEQLLWLGKSAAANDWLRHQRSKEDWWVHLENYPSAHAFFSAQVTPDTPWLTLIASLLRDTAHLTITEIPIIYTKVKNLKAIKGQAGGVTFKKEKHLRLPYQNWSAQLTEIDGKKN